MIWILLESGRFEDSWPLRWPSPRKSEASPGLLNPYPSFRQDLGMDDWMDFGGLMPLCHWHPLLRASKSSTEITKGSSRGATLSFTLRSKGEGGQPRYLILQEIASHFSTPPHPPPPHLPRTLRADSKHCNLQYFCSFRIKKPHFATW